MASLLDIIGSIVVGGMFLLLLFRFNMQTSETAYLIQMQNITSLDAVALSDFLEYDLSKTGYRVVDADVITLADSNTVLFKLDYNDDGNADSIHYSLGDTAYFASSSNPHDRPLYRRLNGGSQELMGAVTDFNISYLDSSGVLISGLWQQANRNKIRRLEVYFKTESREPLENVYQAVEWKRVIFPMNLK